MQIATLPRTTGDHLRHWRQQRRLSQLDLALDAEISARHLSFIETGRAMPSREMLLRLAERLQIPLRDRNRLLLAAGFAPLYPERGLDDPAMASARSAVKALLTAHAPFPALAIDRHWQIVMANDAVAPLLAGAAPHLMAGPVNALRVSLHPDGLAPRILNLGDWRHHLLERLKHQIAETGDTVLGALLAELTAYPAPAPHASPTENAIAVPLRLRTTEGDLSFLSTTMVFGTPRDITLSELAIETFLPADAATAAALHRLSAM
ncbi:helix-turn-helix domain-containing protein [Dongia rigui]|uniref:Helix-turn-helix transcriptional regulator n=1 Tax=Dongia rigui TaxID=940149 RepID=A0ABU5DWU1_9PROT|nr:helix-turn-helix transcriptional regulator [Dongia rigui]MDY0871693.1 helix-turn-helix transcriptional regulator [Dongia rigui]